ncbi:MAG TPA: hypothetical protein VFL90_03120 [Methylomirabilota bacterium]|nr:hypothetical protein [Methylomirabilota bacterium]
MSVADTIRAKIATGELPLERPAKLYTEHGRNEPCSACEQSIGPAQVAYRWEIEDGGRAYRLHAGCAEILEAERLKRGFYDTLSRCAICNRPIREGEGHYRLAESRIHVDCYREFKPPTYTAR